jgi:DNA repair protein RadC
MNAFVSMKNMEFKRELQEEKNTPSEEKSIGLNVIFEVIRIKQVVQEVPTPFAIGAIRSPDDAANIAGTLIGDEDREVFLVLCLNTKNQVTAAHRCHVGSINASIVHAREVFKTAILNNAASIVLSHQHPSGDPTPSMEDLNVTKRLVQAGQLLGIDVLDHVIVTHNGDHYSLKEKGHL